MPDPHPLAAHLAEVLHGTPIEQTLAAHLREAARMAIESGEKVLAGIKVRGCVVVVLPPGSDDA